MLENKKIRVVLADGHVAFREAMTTYIHKNSKEIEIIAQASGGIDFVKILRSGISYDIAMFNMVMGEEDGLSLTKNIKAEFPSIKLLIFSGLYDDEYAIRFIRAGALGFISKKTSVEKIMQSMIEVSQGGLIISERLKNQLAYERLYNVEPLENSEKLSDREFQVMVHLGAGKPPSEVARLLNLSPRTVSTHRNNILRKMKWKNNAEMMLYVVRSGFVR